MSDNGHITAEAVRRYRMKSLPPAELAGAMEHVAHCDECRSLLLEAGTVARVSAALSPEHLSFAELEELAKVPVSQEPADAMEHLAFCAICSEELKDLRSFRDSLTATPASQRTPRHRFLSPALAFAVITLVAVVARFQFRTQPAPAPPATPETRLTVAVSDKSGRIGIDPTGKLSGLATLAPAERDEIAAALREGILPPGPDLRALTRKRETLLAGEAAKKPALAVATPFGEVVASDRPVFRWTAPKGATGFRVAVYDTEFNEVATSPVLSETQWLSATPLPRGKVLIWTVRTNIDGEEVTAPRAPEPEARFEIITAAQQAELTALAGQSTLAYALKAWKLGLRSEARTALTMLKEANAGSTQLARLGAAMGQPR